MRAQRIRGRGRGTGYRNQVDGEDEEKESPNKMSENPRANVGSMTEKKFNWLLDAASPGSNASGKILSSNEARDFIAFIISSPDDEKLATLSRLTSSEYGLTALREALSVENNVKFVKQNVIPLIRFIGSARGASALKVLRTIFEAPSLFPELVEMLIDRKLGQDECAEIGWLVLQLIKGGDNFSLEAKTDRHVLRLARAFSMPGEYPLSKGVSEQINTILDKIHAEPPKNEAKIDNFDQFDQFEQVETSQKTEITPQLQALSYPGWRHSNDKSDFRAILLYPTADELTCGHVEPFLQRTCDVLDVREPRKVSTYLDWAFRLLREDVLCVVKEELDAFLQKPGSSTGKNNPRLASRLNRRTLDVIRFSEISCNQRCGVGFKMAFREPLSLANLLKPKQAQKDVDKIKQDYWDERASFLRVQSILAFIRNNSELVCLGIVNARDLPELVKDPPSIEVSFFDKTDIKRVILELGVDQRDLKAIQLSASFFAFTPILERLKMLSSIPFESELLHNGRPQVPSYFIGEKLEKLVHMLENVGESTNLAQILDTNEQLFLDPSQKLAVTASLRRRVALVQGPPGTGKSYCGAIISKIIFDQSKETILCVTFTNHALDQFLEDLIDFGLPSDQIVRIGGPEKISDRIRPYTLYNLLKNQEKSTSNFRMFRTLRERMSQLGTLINDLNQSIAYFRKSEKNEDFTQFFDDKFCDAFRFPVDQAPDFLWNQWIRGVRKTVGGVWTMEPAERNRKVSEWRQKLIEPYFEQLEREMVRYNELVDELNEMNQISEIELLKSKRIIGCTTTGAAKYSRKLDAVSAGVLIMEEAGEILEAHVVTSLAENCKHLIMIGDHRQLRPKLNNFSLSVESNGPFKFNRSLFERLANRDYPHVTLQLQHRMRPEISDLIRQLTYPELKDADNVKNRPDLPGLTSSVIFVNHEFLEGNDEDLFQTSSEDTLSKINHFEVAMASKIAQYLLFHGYQASQIVILTPYLAQLRAIRHEIVSKFGHQVALSELDQADLYRLGLDLGQSPNLSPKVPTIRVSTVDNYQGEESDIVIVSLVRSNNEGVIGFVGQPERVNVLLSRARDCLILIGNVRTFENCRSPKAGRELWAKLLAALNKQGAIQPGFPAYCSHQNRSFCLATPNAFDEEIKCEACNNLNRSFAQHLSI